MYENHQMKQLVNNPTKYFLGRYIFPIVGIIINVITLSLLYDLTYFYFFHHNSYVVYKDLLKSYKHNIDLNNWRGHRIILWPESKTVSIHNNTDCIIHVFFSANWDKQLNHQIYYLLQ